MQIRTRIAPSPTGQDLHIGTLYTALINWAFAKQQKGQFIVRIEDTDRERHVKGAEARFLKTLKEYDLDYDEGPDSKGKFGPYRQSERLKIYAQYAERLVESDSAYFCTCSKQRLEKIRKDQQKKGQVPQYDRHCLERQDEVGREMQKGKKFVIRLKVPRGVEVIFKDIIRGKISFQSDGLDDQVLLKSDGYPTYHLGVVVDDHLMQISHILRGEEWISSTPKHILLYEAFGWQKPIYCHLPLLRNPDKSKLSKRKNPVWASWYLKQGYLPKAVLNYLCLMGWSHPDQKTVFPLGDFIKSLKLEDISPAGPIFDLKKLEHINGVYIRNLPDKKLIELLNPFFENWDLKIENSVLTAVIPLLKERINVLSEAGEMIKFLFKAPKPAKKLFKGSRVKEELEAVLAVLEKIAKWQSQEIYKKVKDIVKQGKYPKKDFFVNLYVVIEGRQSGLPLFESLEILGKEESLKRIKKALSLF